MKKSWLLLAAACFFVLPGCAEKDKEVSQEKLPIHQEEKKETEELEEYKVELSKHLYEFQFAIDGEKKMLPSSVQEWTEQGWTYHGAEKGELLEAESYMEGEVLEKEGTQLLVDLVNLEGEKKGAKDCYVGGITLEYKKKGSVYQLPENITLGKAVMNQVLEAYGTPTDEYSEKEDLYITYDFGIYKTAEFIFDKEEEILKKVILKNYREPVSEDEQISDEIPEEVERYASPEAFTECLTDYIVSYDDSMYEIPAPVTAFEKNGWEIQKEGSDKYIKAGRHGYVTLKNGKQVLYTVVKNYGDSTVPVKYAFVTKVSGDFDVTKVPIGVGKGIVLGMQEEVMKQQLEGIAYETQDEEKGISYYLYSDESKKNFVRIYVDGDLKIIREIELSNSPETLEKQNQEEDVETLQETVPLGEGL